MTYLRMISDQVAAPKLAASSGLGTVTPGTRSASHGLYFSSGAIGTPSATARSAHRDAKPPVRVTTPSADTAVQRCGGSWSNSASRSTSSSTS